ncbi:MAG: cyclodeaminase/cyclohydrolase family protein [Ruminococcaceae bacterium]|jgi:formiminotetrahydrofolate cyclodeaminase|nr:cyclodeaminase/cyclohydrolase family protein [Oscillospiraceae bacterium]
MKLIEMTVDKYVDTVASDAPAPGGGSVSALAGAQGAGLATMVAALTVGKKKYLDYAETCNQVIETGMPYVQSLKEQVDRDTDAFDMVSAAFKLPKETDEQKAARSAAIQAGTLVSTQVPFETMTMALEALRNAQKLLGGFNTNCASDLGVAALQLNAAVKGAWLNVLINIGGMKDKEKAAEYREKGQAIVDEAEGIAFDIYSEVERIVNA